MNPESICPDRSHLRTETVATRLSLLEMYAIEAAAKAAGVTCSQWLRDLALSHLAQPEPMPRPSIDSVILEEIMGLQNLVLNLFARATPAFTLQTLHEIMAIANNGKHGAAGRVLASPKENPTPQ